VRVLRPTAGGKAHFYGDKVKLTEEEAKPLVKDDRVRKGAADQVLSSRVEKTDRTHGPAKRAGCVETHPMR
jgi:hypothetical protein